MLAIRKKSVGGRRLISWFMRHYYGCDIPIDANIADDVSFQHSALGVVISKYAVVESKVIIQHGVTLGASKGLENAPVVHKGAILGARATIIGHVEIGKGAIVGAGAIVTKDVPPFHTVVGVNKVFPNSSEMETIRKSFE